MHAFDDDDDDAMDMDDDVDDDAVSYPGRMDIPDAEDRMDLGDARTTADDIDPTEVLPSVRKRPLTPYRAAEIEAWNTVAATDERLDAKTMQALACGLCGRYLHKELPLPAVMGARFPFPFPGLGPATTVVIDLPLLISWQPRLLAFAERLSQDEVFAAQESTYLQLSWLLGMTARQDLLQTRGNSSFAAEREYFLANKAFVPHGPHMPLLFVSQHPHRSELVAARWDMRQPDDFLDYFERVYPGRNEPNCDEVMAMIAAARRRLPLALVAELLGEDMARLEPELSTPALQFGAFWPISPFRAVDRYPDTLEGGTPSAVLDSFSLLTGRWTLDRPFQRQGPVSYDS
jgi:hypothetical protein